MEEYIAKLTKKMTGDFQSIFIAFIFMVTATVSMLHVGNKITY